MALTFNLNVTPIHEPFIILTFHLNLQEKEMLADELECSKGDLEESKHYIQQLHQSQVEEKREKARYRRYRIVLNWAGEGRQAIEFVFVCECVSERSFDISSDRVKDQ